jgi:hypothetical protein
MPVKTNIKRLALNNLMHVHYTATCCRTPVHVSQQVTTSVHGHCAFLWHEVQLKSPLTHVVFLITSVYIVSVIFVLQKRWKWGYEWLCVSHCQILNHFTDFRWSWRALKLRNILNSCKQQCWRWRISKTDARETTAILSVGLWKDELIVTDTGQLCYFFEVMFSRRKIKNVAAAWHFM